MVTNPVDILTNIAIKMFPDKKNQIFGSGTVLDTARFRFLLGEKTEVNPTSLHAYIVGEHGDSEVPLWSTAMVGNTPLDQFHKLSPEEKNIIFNEAKNAAYAIIEGKQSTYYAVAAGIVSLVNSVLYNKKTVFTVSHQLNGLFDINGVCLSLPRVVGANGILRDIEIAISPEEKAAIQQSANNLAQAESTLL
jgi:L-lactate dehydrogenase